MFDDIAYAFIRCAVAVLCDGSGTDEADSHRSWLGTPKPVIKDLIVLVTPRFVVLTAPPQFALITDHRYVAGIPKVVAHPR
jgi:hypothetical protein